MGEIKFNRNGGWREGGRKKNGDSLKWHFLAWGLGEESRLWNLFRKLLKQLVMFFLKNTHTHTTHSRLLALVLFRIMSVFMWLFDPKAMFPRDSVLKFQKIGHDYKEADDADVIKWGQGWVGVHFQDRNPGPAFLEMSWKEPCLPPAS